VSVEYLGLSEIKGQLVVLDNVSSAAFDEMVHITLSDGKGRLGR